jgi:hypothetical protein
MNEIKLNFGDEQPLSDDESDLCLRALRLVANDIELVPAELQEPISSSIEALSQSEMPDERITRSLSRPQVVTVSEALRELEKDELLRDALVGGGQLNDEQRSLLNKMCRKLPTEEDVMLAERFLPKTQP